VTLATPIFEKKLILRDHVPTIPGDMLVKFEVPSKQIKFARFGKWPLVHTDRHTTRSPAVAGMADHTAP